MSRAEPDALRIERLGDALSLKGRLDVSSAPALLRHALPLPDGIDALELGALEAIDSAGVASLRLLQRHARASGRSLRLRQPPPRFAAICAAHRLDPL